jgi:hypothetical protein
LRLVPRFRYSITALQLAVTNIVLLLNALTVFDSAESSSAVARAGLSFCALFFSLLCWLFGESASRTLWLVAVLYAWGHFSLLLVGSFQVHDLLRWLLAAIGISFVMWALFSGGGPAVATPARR